MLARTSCTSARKAQSSFSSGLSMMSRHGVETNLQREGWQSNVTGSSKPAGDWSKWMPWTHAGAKLGGASTDHFGRGGLRGTAGGGRGNARAAKPAPSGGRYVKLLPEKTPEDGCHGPLGAKGRGGEVIAPVAFLHELSVNVDAFA